MLRSLLFENPWALGGVLIVVEFFLWRIWLARRTRQTAWLAIAGLAAIPLLLALQHWVVTEQERIRETCNALAQIVADGDASAFGKHVHERFEHRQESVSWSKNDLIDAFDRLVRQWKVEEQRLGGFDIQLDGDETVVTFTAYCRLIGTEFTVPRHVSQWRLVMKESGDRWLLIGVDETSGAAYPYNQFP